jgi:superfamily II DNA or RNA helicase
MTTLILTWAGKSPHGLIQKIGRAVRTCEGKTGVDIFCFGEMGNKYFDKHTKIRIGKLVDDGYDVEILKETK